MKKTTIGLFFLSFFLVLPAQAAEMFLTVPSDYNATHIVSLGNVVAFTFDFEGNYIVAENLGNAYRVSKVAPDGTATVLLDRTSQGITNLSYYQGKVYVVTRGQVFKISKGKISDVVTGLPSDGDYGNSSVVFNNGYMYVATGTATNSGIVGADNSWLAANPSERDIPCTSVKLAGVNFTTDNFLTAKRKDTATTGSFSPFNTPVDADQIIHGMNKCNGAIIKTTSDGVVSQVYAWGFHNPKGLSVDDDGNLWLFDGGMEDRGIRPVKNGKDAFYQVSSKVWYGWPDFSAGTQVDQPPILAEFPNTPPKPQSEFDLGQIRNMIISPKVFAANSGLAQTADDKLLRLDLNSKKLNDFLTVSNGKIIQYKFGPDDKLYLLVSGAKGKTELYSVESTTPQVSTVIGTTKPKANINWIFGALLAVSAGVGFFVIRNLQRPIPPI